MKPLEAPAPRVGQTGYYHRFLGRTVEVDPTPVSMFTVTRVEGNIAWATYSYWPDTGEERDPSPFIWRFKDRPNRLHLWPGHPDYATYHGEPANA